MPCWTRKTPPGLAGGVRRWTVRRYKKYSTLVLSRLPWPWLMALLETINLAVDARLHREEP